MLLREIDADTHYSLTVYSLTSHFNVIKRNYF